MVDNNSIIKIKEINELTKNRKFVQTHNDNKIKINSKLLLVEILKFIINIKNKK